MRTIEQLNTLLEELEKRIRNISTAQSTLSQINNICTYIANVQDYLKELNVAFDSHVKNCQDYSDDIANLQNQINVISNNLEELIANDETFNALKTSFDELKSQFENLVGASSTTVETLESDISLLQTTLSSTEEDLQDLQSELSVTNQTVGQHSTTITNLQTTQTNLQTTQSSQASTINSLNTRLTTCENNVNSLSGGVDISDYEARLTALEQTVNTLYEVRVYLRKVIDEITISEIIFKIYSRNELTQFSQVVDNMGVFEISVSGFYYDNLVYGAYGGNSERLTILTMGSNLSDNTVNNWKRTANINIGVNDSSWAKFIFSQKII